MVRKLELLIRTGIGVVAALNLASYFTKPNITEAEILKTTSAYVQRYDGEPVKDILDHVQSTLKVAEKNPKLSEDVKRLEIEFSQIYEIIRRSTNPIIYKQVLREFGYEIGTIAEKNKKSPMALWMGIVGGLVSLLWTTDQNNYRKNSNTLSV